MKVRPFIAGVYYSIRYLADEVDNTFSMGFSPCYAQEYQTLCYNTAKAYKTKAKANFRLALEKDITDMLKKDVKRV